MSWNLIILELITIILTHFSFNYFIEYIRIYYIAINTKHKM